MDVGLGKRIATIVAKRLTALLSERGQKPDALLMTRERFTAHESVSQGAITLDGSENASVVYSRCCRPLPGDDIVGYLGRGEGLAVHTRDCTTARKLEHKDSERFIGVEWSDEMSRNFETVIHVSVVNGKGVLARVAGALASAETDIVHVDMGSDSPQDMAELKFVIAVRDTAHLEQVLRQLKRTPSVVKAERQAPKSHSVV
jgi:GTP pyrophosphokinase